MHLLSNRRLERFERRMEALEGLLWCVLGKEKEIMAKFDDVTAGIASVGDGINKLTALCDAQFAALQAQQQNPDPAALDAAVAALTAQRAEVDAALGRDTPPAPSAGT